MIKYSVRELICVLKMYYWKKKSLAEQGENLNLDVVPGRPVQCRKTIARLPNLVKKI